MIPEPVLKVKGKFHPNGGGWVSDTARVESSCYIGPDVCVQDNAVVRGLAHISGDSVIAENAVIEGSARVSSSRIWSRATVGDFAVVSNAKIYGKAIIDGNAEISGYGVFICGSTQMGDHSKIICNTKNIHFSKFVHMGGDSCLLFDENKPSGHMDVLEPLHPLLPNVEPYILVMTDSDGKTRFIGKESVMADNIINSLEYKFDNALVMNHAAIPFKVSDNFKVVPLSMARIVYL